MAYLGRTKLEPDGHKYAISDTPEALERYPEPIDISCAVPGEALDRLLKLLNEGGFFSFEKCAEAKVSAGVGTTDSWNYIVISGNVEDVLEGSNPCFRGIAEHGTVIETGFNEHRKVKPKTGSAIVVQVKSTIRPQGIVYFLEGK